MTFRDLFGPISESGAIAIAICLSLGWFWWRVRHRRHSGRAMGIDTSDPLWIVALGKARTSVPRFLDLARTNPDGSFVKYALQTTSGTIEHVWGAVLAVSEGAITVGLDTPPVDGKPTSAPPYQLALSEIEDWRVELPDGRIHGAYTARAHFEYARKHRVRLPAEQLAIEKNLVDA
jgi:hypothetical protein